MSRHITRARYHASAALICLVLSCVPPEAGLAQSPVRLEQEPLTIPTYRIGPPDLDPIFYAGRAYQGAKGPVYPYPILDKITDVREPHTYQAAYLENQYLKLCVLPEIGGRILFAQDKTDGYDFFYHQHVIKPALIGMLGAWISGGVEWNVPHHHRATTFMPVDYALVRNPDGSGTIWVGEIELRHRMKWLVGLTLYPGKSYLEASVKLFNRTPYAHSFLYFANVAVHANENYQVIFPPRTEIATFHGKNRFLRWPFSDRDFSGVDFGKPVDVSWWKNHPSPTSWFAFNSQEDFFAGYDHGRQAGVVHVADHHVVPGKKFWTWGNGPEGRMWDKILTDSDGPYIELMAGAYSDNQPDYSWVQPYEVKTFKQYWYPIRKMEGVKNANLDAAVNLDVDASRVAHVAFNTTSEFQNAHAVLAAGEKVLFERHIDISPENPFAQDVPLPAGVSEADLRVSLSSAEGRELVSYTPVKPLHPPLPEPVKRPPAPKDIKTVEELYLTGLRLVQFYNPVLDPYPYFEEALRRDPGNARVNTELAVLDGQHFRFKEAEDRLQTAIARVTRDYTSPEYGEPFYYLGEALAAQGKYDEAFDAFYKATWSWAWNAAGYFQLAQLACRKNDFTRALEFADRSLAANALNTQARDLKAAIERHLGRIEERGVYPSRTLLMDPLDFWAGNEYRLARLQGPADESVKREIDALVDRMRNNPQSYLELAADYADAGLWDDAIDVLSRPEDSELSGGVYPLVYYYLGYFWEMKGNSAAAAKYYRLASKMPPDFCFPFRWESLEVLRHALKSNAEDARAAYYLGNLLYDNQPREAIRAWETSRALDGNFALVHRNLAFAYAQAENDIPKAIRSQEKAVALDANDPRFLLELDELYQQGGVSPEKRLAGLEAREETVEQRDDALEREIVLCLEVGKLDRALGLLSHHTFHVWEGGGDIHDVYISANLLMGQRLFQQGRYQQALELYQAALDYPENLQVGRPNLVPRDAEAYYFVGTAYEALGDHARAKEFYGKSVAARAGRPEVNYFRGLALRKLGEGSRAGELFAELIKSGRSQMAAAPERDYFAKFGVRRPAAARLAQAHFLMGLGYLGQGKRQEAQAEFERARAQDIDHLGARSQLAALERPPRP